MHKLIHKRIFWGCLILCMLLAGLIIRLAWVQLLLKDSVVSGTRYTVAQMAELQSERETVLDSGRGRLYAKNGEALAGETVWTAALFPPEEELHRHHGAGEYNDDQQLHRLAEILGVSYSQLQERRLGLKEPLLWPSGQGTGPLALTLPQAREVEALAIEGVRALPLPADITGLPPAASGSVICLKLRVQLSPNPHRAENSKNRHRRAGEDAGAALAGCGAYGSRRPG